MDADDKKRIADLNEATDRRTDLLLGAAAKSPYTWLILLLFGGVCFIAGAVMF